MLAKRAMMQLPAVRRRKSDPRDFRSYLQDHDVPSSNTSRRQCRAEDRDRRAQALRRNLRQCRLHPDENTDRERTRSTCYSAPVSIRTDMLDATSKKHFGWYARRPGGTLRLNQLEHSSGLSSTRCSRRVPRTTPIDRCFVATPWRNRGLFKDFKLTMF